MTTRNVTPEEKTLRASILRVYSKIIEEVTGIYPEEAKEEHNHIDDLGLDSLYMVEIAVHVEDAYGINIPSEDLAQLRTVKDVVDYILQIIRENPQEMRDAVQRHEPAEVEALDAYVAILQ